MNAVTRESFIIFCSLIIGACISAVITILMNRSIMGNHDYDAFYSIKLYATLIFFAVDSLVITWVFHITKR